MKASSLAILQLELMRARRLSSPPHFALQAGAGFYEPPEAVRKSLMSTVFAGTEVAGEFTELQQILSNISASHSGKERQPLPDDTALQGK